MQEGWTTPPESWLHNIRRFSLSPSLLLPLTTLTLSFCALYLFLLTRGEVWGNGTNRWRHLGPSQTHYLKQMQDNYTWPQPELTSDLLSSPGFCLHILDSGYMEPEWVSPMTRHWPHEYWLSNVPHVYLEVREYWCLLGLPSISICVQHVMLDFICF